MREQQLDEGVRANIERVIEELRPAAKRLATEFDTLPRATDERNLDHAIKHVEHALHNLWNILGTPADKRWC